MELDILVYTILVNDITARGNNDYLYSKVCEKMGVDLTRISASDFFKYRKDWKLPPFESVTRARRKVQERNKELLPPEKIVQKRKEWEEKYSKYGSQY